MKKSVQPHIEFSNSFNKDRKAAPLTIKIAFLEAYEIFRDNSQSEILRNHSLNKLGKRYHGLWSINVTDDWRAIYRKENNEIIFIMLKTHKLLYGK